CTRSSSISRPLMRTQVELLFVQSNSNLSPGSGATALGSVIAHKAEHLGQLERPLSVDKLYMNARHAGWSNALSPHHRMYRQLILFTRQPDKSTYWQRECRIDC